MFLFAQSLVPYLELEVYLPVTISGRLITIARQSQHKAETESPNSVTTTTTSEPADAPTVALTAVDVFPLAQKQGATVPEGNQAVAASSSTLLQVHLIFDKNLPKFSSKQNVAVAMKSVY